MTPNAPDEIFIQHPNHITSVYLKPNPAAFAPTIEKLRDEFNINPNEIVAVGDSLVDLEAANANNIMFVGVLTGAVNTKARWIKWARNRNLLITSNQIIPSIKDLPSWLAENCK